MSAISRAHSSYSSNKRSSFGRGMSYKSGPPLNLHIPGASSLTISLANTNSSNPSTAGAQPLMKGPTPSSSSSNNSQQQQPAFLLNRTRITTSNQLAQQDRSSLAGGPQYWVSPGTASTRRATSRRSRSRGAAAAEQQQATVVVLSEEGLNQVVELAQQKVLVPRGNNSNTNRSTGAGPCDGGAAERDALAYKSMQFKVSSTSSAASFRSSLKAHLVSSLFLFLSYVAPVRPFSLSFVASFRFSRADLSSSIV